MCENEDILKIIPNEDIPKLRDMYKQYFPRTVYVYNFLNSAIKWKTRCPEENYDTIMAPYGNWKSGTFVAVHQCNGYEVFICTLEKNYDTLYELIVKTKKVKWYRRMLIYAVHDDHQTTILKALDKTNFAFLRDIPCNVWWMPRNKALKLQIQCGPDIQVKKLEKTHAGIINFHWPHKFLGSEKYVQFVIEMNGGCGVFLKSSNTLVAWILRIQMGLGMLHVVEDHKRKGYGALVTKVLSKEIAEEGVNPLSTVLTSNKTAQAMFEKIGFQKSEFVSYIESREEHTVDNFPFAEKNAFNYFSSLGV